MEGLRLMKRDGVKQTEARAGGEGGLMVSMPATVYLLPGRRPDGEHPGHYPLPVWMQA